MQSNLFDLQKSALDKIFYAPANRTPEGWKILISDSIGSKIIQSYYTIIDLRQNMFTLELSIQSKQRESMPGVTAVYFLEPSQTNIARITEDAKNILYSRVQIHFISFLGRESVDNLAKDFVSKAPEFVKGIKKLDYFHMNFLPIDKDMVILPTENQLSSLLANLQYPPVFIYPNDQTQFVSKVLTKVKQIQSQSSRKNSQGCTIIIVGSRSMDYEPVFEFSNMFAHLAINVSEIKDHNKLVIQNQQFVLNDKNKFWLENKLMITGELGDKSRKMVEQAKKKNEQKMASIENISKNQKFDFDVFILQKQKKELELNVLFMKQVMTKAMKGMLDALETVNIRDFKMAQIRQIFTKSKSANYDLSKESKLSFVISYMICNHKMPLLDQLQELIKDIKKPALYTLIKNQKLEQLEGRAKQADISEGTMKKVVSKLWSMYKIPQSKVLVFPELVSTALRGLAEVKQRNQYIIAKQENYKKVKTVVLYIRGGINYLEYQKVVKQANKSGAQLIYAGDKIAKAGDLLKQ